MFEMFKKKRGGGRRGGFGKSSKGGFGKAPKGGRAQKAQAYGDTGGSKGGRSKSPTFKEKPQNVISDSRRRLEKIRI